MVSDMYLSLLCSAQCKNYHILRFWIMAIQGRRQDFKFGDATLYATGSHWEHRVEHAPLKNFEILGCLRHIP